ncbi:phosphoglycerate mutase-like protein [Trichoderma citrinoviride]|uniref:Phosphoglycerate mutase-like protein n=1 Tax=Trichoderma citrinoviride TaxID=58853 RepID=A0A2T4BG61_9HYPO|nr:phosphoglycerate mutase-like protein [Trichoderma citrinoviride]PTB68316.1 phosphoglycerate mutase-like protein [Trichoderma citrinoviride]
MPPTIHLVRHAQGYHNLSPENEKLPDPDLTPLGLQQCADLRAAFPHHARLRRLVASGMRRTLYTCLHAFAPSTDDDNTDNNNQGLLPVIALDTLQEVSDAPSDTGSPLAKLKEEFGDKVDLSRMREGWNDKAEGSYFEPTLEKLATRARDARRALREIAAASGDDDAHLAVVSHGAFLHFLTEEWHGITSTYPTSWTNCEYRTYQFVDPTGQDPDAELRETDESWRRRHGSLKVPSAEEQRELREMMVRELSPFFKVKGTLKN